jgi:uncharacterized protein YhhL (DUF1145 family)
MHFGLENTLKNNHNYTSKQELTILLFSCFNSYELKKKW